MKNPAVDGHAIGTLGKLTGVNVETIRYYERIGLLPRPARTSGNRRTYGDADVRRLIFVRKARELGFPIDTVRALLELAAQPNRPCYEVDALVVSQMGEVDRKTADLARLRDDPYRLAAQCPCAHASECRTNEFPFPR